MITFLLSVFNKKGERFLELKHHFWDSYNHREHRMNIVLEGTNWFAQDTTIIKENGQVLELEMADGVTQYAMQTTLDSMLQTSFSMNYQMIGSFAINDTKTPIPLTKTDNTIVSLTA